MIFEFSEYFNYFVEFIYDEANFKINKDTICINTLWILSNNYAHAKENFQTNSTAIFLPTFMQER